LRCTTSSYDDIDTEGDVNMHNDDNDREGPPIDHSITHYNNNSHHHRYYCHPHQYHYHSNTNTPNKRRPPPMHYDDSHLQYHDSRSNPPPLPTLSAASPPRHHHHHHNMLLPSLPPLPQPPVVPEMMTTPYRVTHPYSSLISSKFKNCNNNDNDEAYNRHHYPHQGMIKSSRMSPSWRSFPPPCHPLPFTTPYNHRPYSWSSPPGSFSPPDSLPSLSPCSNKRRCTPLKPPVPSRYQGDNMEEIMKQRLPDFMSLMNFPSAAKRHHYPSSYLTSTNDDNNFSQRKRGNYLPENMRFCVMCGKARPLRISSNNTNLSCSKTSKQKNKKEQSTSDSNTQMGKENNGVGDGGNNKTCFDDENLIDMTPMIPMQNKGLCTICDVTVWVITIQPPTTPEELQYDENLYGLEIKWCKGCKNFRPWAAFGTKGKVTKCFRCRERQRTKYKQNCEKKRKEKIKEEETKSGTNE